MKCWLESHIEAKWFWNYGCKCNQLASIKEKHGFCHKWERNRFYEIYCGIRTRCKWTSWKEARKWYHDKGIKNEWNTFEEFKNDMYDSYLDHVKKFWIKNTSIDRIDWNWNYCKDNCRWATCTEQNKNRYITNYVEYNWKRYSAWELAEETWMTRLQASSRISSIKSWSIPITSLLKPHKDKFILSAEIDWKTYYAKDISNLTWINERWWRQRLRDYIDWKITKEKLFRIKSK